MVEIKVPLAVFYRDMTEWQKKAPEYAANATMNAIDRVGYEPFVQGKAILRSGNTAVSQGLVTVPVPAPVPAPVPVPVPAPVPAPVPVTHSPAPAAIYN